MSADLVLVVANVVYATSYAATRLTLDHVPPATLALIRLVIGALVLIPLAVALRPAAAAPIRRADRWSILWMGVLGFAGGLAFSQLITLYVTPVVYTYLDALQHRFGRARRSVTEAAAAD